MSPRPSLYIRTGGEVFAGLSGRSVGVVLGSFQEAFLRDRYPDADVVTFTDDEDVILAISRGEVDAGLAEDPAVEALLDRMGMRGRIASTGQPLLRNELFFGVRKGETALLRLIEERLDALSLDEFAEIERRWIPQLENLYFVDRPILLSAAERAWLSEHPVLRVHNETDWEPFNFYENGRPLGFSIDYMNLLADKLGVEVEYVSGPTWDEFLGLIRNKDLDVMLNIVLTPAREEYILYTDSYLDNLPVIVVRDESQGVGGFEDLFGRTLAIPRGFSYQEIIERDYPGIELLLLGGQLECLNAVAVGRADATIGGIAVQNHLIEKHQLSNLKIVSDLPEGVFSNKLRIGVRDDWPLLRDILQKAILSVDPLEVQDIRRRWLGELVALQDASALVQLTAEEESWLAEHPTIRLGVDPAYPPFEFISAERAYLGMASEYVRLVEERLGVNLDVVPGLDWSGALEGIRGGTVDVLPAVMNTPERDEFMEFTSAYMNFPDVIVMREDHPLIAGLADLKGRKVALIQGYAATERVTSSYPTIQRQTVQTPLEALRAVSNGEVDATVISLAVATYLIDEANITNLVVAAPTGLDLLGLSFGVRRDWGVLVGILEKVLASIPPEEVAAIRANWVATQYPVVILTAHSDADLVAAGVALDANDFVVKLVSRDELLSRVRKATSRTFTLKPEKEYAAVEVPEALSW